MSRCVVCRCCCDGDPSHKKDSAWAWMVCFAASTNLAFTMGLVYSFGVLLPVFMDYFNESRERTAWIGSLSISLGLFFGPFAGTLINRFGCRVVSMTGGLICALSLTIASFAKSLILLYLSYSVLGMGGICVFLSSMVIVRNCFDKQQSVAVGIASTGQGVGIMVLSQVLQSLIISVEWRNTLRIVAGSLFLNNFFGILYDSKMEPSNSGESLSCREAGQGLQMSQCFTLHCSVWKVPSFLAVVSLFFFMMFGRTIIYVLLVKYSEDLGISSNASSRLVLYLGINMVIGRFACGFLCSLKRLNNWFILQGMLLLNTISTIMLTLANSYAGLVIYAIIFGLCDGAMATVFNIQVLTCVDQSQAASAYGLTLMIGSVTSLIGPPLSGFTVDKLGSYGPAFYMAAGALAVASLIPCVLHCLHTSEIKRTEVLSEAQELEQWSHDRDNCVCHFSRTPTDLDQVQFVSTV